MTVKPNRYDLLIEEVFFRNYQQDLQEIIFERAEIERAAARLAVKLPKNLGDVLYSFRYRTELPERIKSMAPEGFEWVIRPAGRSKYKMVLIKQAAIIPTPMLAETKIPDATPGIISRYALSDEQALLTRIRYNRLIDIFTGIACYSLQNHLRTSVKGMGQIETDEIYVGVDKRGVQYVLPVQAKGKKDRIGVIQIEQDILLCTSKFPALVCRPIAAQSMNDDMIALFEFEDTQDGLKILSERHYRLVRPKEVSVDDLQQYQQRG